MTQIKYKVGISLVGPEFKKSTKNLARACRIIQSFRCNVITYTSWFSSHRNRHRAVIIAIVIVIFYQKFIEWNHLFFPLQILYLIRNFNLGETLIFTYILLYNAIFPYLSHIGTNQANQDLHQKLICIEHTYTEVLEPRTVMFKKRSARDGRL